MALDARSLPFHQPQELGYRSPVPHGADGGELRVEVGVGELAFGNAAWKLEVDVRSAHNKRARWRSVRIQSVDAQLVRPVGQNHDVQPILGRSLREKGIADDDVPHLFGRSQDNWRPEAKA